MGQTVPSAGSGQLVAVIGSGFAGAATAYALALRGQDVAVFDPALSAGTSGTHRGHRAGAMTPALSRDDDIRMRLSRAGVFLALLRWQALGASARPQRCGTFQPVVPHEQPGWRWVLQRLQFPADYVSWVSAVHASRLTGVSCQYGGIWHAYGHIVHPEPFLAALLNSPLIRLHASQVERLERNDKGRWLLYNACDKQLTCADHVVVANSWQAARLLHTIPGLPVPLRLRSLHRVAGQLSYFAGSPGGLRSALAGDGICLPDGESGLIGGSTYVTNTTLSIITQQGHHENRDKVVDLLHDQPLRLRQPSSMADGWAGWRAAVRDRLPVIGPVPKVPGLWLACGFGSRGLTWSALGAELIAAKLNREPIPLERELLKKVAPL